MTPEQWNQVKLIFESLINLEPAQQKTYLHENCQDQDVRKEVESLLFHHRKADNFLAEISPETVAATFSEAKNDRQQKLNNLIGTKANNRLPGTIENDFKGTSRFLIQRRLGSGGFGVVYQAYDLERGSVVALKTLHHSDAGVLYRFKKEFRALTDLAHPNLAALYELFSEQEQWFFTMEMINGKTFLEYVKSLERTDIFDCWADLPKLRAALKQDRKSVV